MSGTQQAIPTGQAPAQPQQPQQQAGGQQAVPAGQVQPVSQSENLPRRAPTFVDPRPYAALNDQKRELVDTVAQEAGISPLRLAAHWYVESRGRLQSPDSNQGAVGPMQVLPSTAKSYNNGGNLDIHNPIDNLRIGANYIRHLDDTFGKDTPASIIAYHGGEGSVQDIQEHPDGAMARHPKSMQYLQDVTASKDVQGLLSQIGNTTPNRIDPQEVLRQGVQSGPDGVLKYIANSKGSQVTMTGAWQAAEGALQRMFIQRGDLDGAAKASQFVLQMSHEGSNQYLMAAQKAMANGDSVGAANLLAKAHAFFPDDSMGQFGVDAKGNVYGQRVSENDGSPVGAPFQVTQQGLMSMLNQTADPNQYLDTVMKEQANVAATNHQNAIADYYHDRLPSAERIAQTRADATVTAAADRGEATVDAASVRSAARQGQGPAAALAKQADKEVSDTYGSDVMPNVSDTNRMTMAQIHHDARMNGADPVTAEFAAKGIGSGKLGIRQQSDGTFGVVDPKNPTKPPIAYLSPALAQSISPHAPGQPGQRGVGGGLVTPGQVGNPGTGVQGNSPVGAGANSGVQLGAGNTNPNLSGTSESSAVPVQPQTNGPPTSPQPSQQQ